MRLVNLARPTEHFLPYSIVWFRTGVKADLREGRISERGKHLVKS